MWVINKGNTMKSDQEQLEESLFAIKKLQRVLGDEAFSEEFKEQVRIEMNAITASFYEFEAPTLVRFILDFEGF